MDMKFLHFLYDELLSMFLRVVQHVSMCVLAERFGKKLEELCRERGALKLGLPSRQPSVALFLERLRQVVHSALQRADCCQCRSVIQHWKQGFHDPKFSDINNINVTVMINYCFFSLT